MTRAERRPAGAKVKAADLDRIAAGTHPDPHGVLGAHPLGAGVVVRAFRPGAEQVRVLAEGHEPVALEPKSPAGLFEGTVELEGPPYRYRLEITHGSGEPLVAGDPYRFLPSLGELDLHLAGEGRHQRLYESLGAHQRELEGEPGVAFAVWAPNARGVRLVGDFNLWDGRAHPMRSLGATGIWELFVPGLEAGTRYKFEVDGADGSVIQHADPLAQATEVPPRTASVVQRADHGWDDEAWVSNRRSSEPLTAPISIYEVHLGSWRQGLSYAELAEQLGAYVNELGFTHVELMPVMEHPFAGSWGYQVTGFFAPTSRFGSPDEFRAFVDSLHRQGIGVILDWVPAHFPRDEWSLARFDGTALYEHADPRRGAHPDWGTLVFNLARNEVRNFLLASALFWLRECHVDGLRVDAVASMLYLDYSRKPGEWVPNALGGREDLDSVAFLRELNELVYAQDPGVISAAEESTAWPAVSRPTYLGGLGFGFKWNMGWMHDTLGYFAHEPVHRRFHHHELTFSLIYAFSENFILPLSHDEVVHGKGSLLAKMPGDRWQQLANLRSLYAFMWAHPGKKLLFMGGELAQETEWNHDRSLEWELLERPAHAAVRSLVRDLNGVYRNEPALYEVDFEPAGFRWLDANDADRNILAFLRLSADGSRALACICNLSPVPREGYRVGLPHGGRWREALNTDSELYGGSNVGNLGGVEAVAMPWHGQPWSAEVALPPLGVLWLAP
jgi:1,4-alpha-glucan branching enzyme